MNTKVVDVKVPDGCNVILGQSHFIKTVEDLYEALVNAVPDIKFGLGFCESSGPCLVRFEGNDAELKELASKTAFQLAAGHTFIIFMRNAYPINVLDKVKAVPEVCSIYCATANPFQVILAERIVNSKFTEESWYRFHDTYHTGQTETLSPGGRERR